MTVVQGVLIDEGGGGFHVKPTGSTTPGSDNVVLADGFAAADEDVPLILAAGTYYVTQKFTGKKLHLDCRGEVILKRTDSANEPVIEVGGSVGAYSALDADAERGTNVIVCEGLAAELSRGDLVQITSDVLFWSGGNIKQGEQAIVRSVDDTTIYLAHVLNDSYAQCDGAKVARVSPGGFIVSGKLIIDHTPDVPDDATAGVTLSYCLGPRGHMEFRNTTAAGLRLFSCFAPDFDITAWNVGEEDPGASGKSGYIISVNNSTMYGQFRGHGAFCRHGIANGGSPGYVGVGWGNRFRGITMHGGGGTAVFDAHGEGTGSVFFDDCVAVGGNISDPTADDARPVGLSSAARYTYVTNFTAIGCRAAVGTRTDAALIEEFVVDGLHIVEGQGQAFSKQTGSPAIRRLVVRGVTGANETGGFAALNFASGDVTEWLFEDIHLTGALLFNVGSGISTLPAELSINRFTTQGLDAAEASTSIRGVRINSGSSIRRVVLRDGRMADMYRGIVVESELDLLELVNVDMDRSFQHVYLNGATVAHLKMRGGSFRRARHGSASSGVIVAAGGGTIGVLDVDGCAVETDTWLAGSSALAGSLILGTLQSHAGLLGYVRNPASTLVEILSGSPAVPRLLRGTGSPHGVVTAPRGAIFQRADGSSGTLLYVNTDGATAWTAYA